MKRLSLKIFFCYAHADRGLRDRLLEHLEMLEREGLVTPWYDGRITPVGDLSAVVCHGPPPEVANSKYRKWADRLLETVSIATPRLRRETRFWIEAWKRGSVRPWAEYGATSLTFLEYQLIGVASDLFPDVLLNTDGVNRC